MQTKQPRVRTQGFPFALLIPVVGIVLYAMAWFFSDTNATRQYAEREPVFNDPTERRYTFNQEMNKQYRTVKFDDEE